MGPRSTMAAICQFGMALLCRRTTTFVVVGARRAGNHAAIGWIASCAEGCPVTLERRAGPHVLSSSSGRTVVLNEINRPSNLRFLGMLMGARSIIRTADTVIVSFEDCTSVHVESSPRRPRRPEASIVVTRSTLNLVASRLEFLRRRAANGLDSTGMGIDEHLIAVLIDHRGAEAIEHWTSFDFDAWASEDSLQRAERARVLGFDNAHSPGMTRAGGGSSFTGRASVPDAAALLLRFDAVDVPERVLELLADHPTLLSNEERQIVDARRSA